MTPSLVMLEPQDARAWAPFLGARPICELRAGVWRIRERWEAALGTGTTAIMGERAVGFHELDEPRARPLGPVTGPAVVARADFAPSGERHLLPRDARRVTHGGETVAWVLREGETWDGPHEEGDAVEMPGLLLRGAFDLVTALERFLADDCADFAVADADPIPDESVVLGDADLVRVFGAIVEPGVVFDVRGGAVVLERGAEVRHGTRLEGPCYVGAGTRVLGGYVRASIFGPRCNVRGEIAASVFTGF
ncbi:MAG TPA: putative sugar nucleotidyl transferase, partial [Gemmatimonadales bacterium]|nr:putative sugar nucleotidyl transferase [Gemmatimonadales bacterium]